MDSLIIGLAVIASYLLRFDGEIPPSVTKGIWVVFLLFWGITLLLFHFFRLYQRLWQYASIGELVSIVRATTLSMLVVFGIHYSLLFWGESIIIPRSVIVICGLLVTVGIGATRFLIRIVQDDYIRKSKRRLKKALIVGAGDAGVLVARELKKSDQEEFYIAGFIDDDPLKCGMRVLGVSVLGDRYAIPRLAKSNEVDLIIIAIPSASREEVAKIINICKETDAQIKILPCVSDVISGKVSVSMIRDVQVEDLLGREPVQVDLDEIAGYVTGKTVLVTGAGGSIGSELCRQLARFAPSRLLLLGRGENSLHEIEWEMRHLHPDLRMTVIVGDIQDERRIRQLFMEYRPEVVFHAAAHKHVPMMEANPGEAIKNNVFGTQILAESADQFGVGHFVMISTDKAVNPTSVMGVTKRIAEMIVQDLARRSATKFAAVRFGNVLGSRGSVIPIFKRQIERGGPVTVTHPDMVRYFMTISEAVQLVIQAGALAKGGEVFVLDMGEPVRIEQLARDLIRLSGLEVDKDIRIVYTGIRPGEKLYEEILLTEESAQSTKHNRIYIEKPLEVDTAHLAKMLQELKRVVYQSESPLSPDTIRAILQMFVPSYQWQESDNRADSQPKVRNKWISSIMETAADGEPYTQQRERFEKRRADVNWS